MVSEETMKKFFELVKTQYKEVAKYRAMQYLRK